MHSVKNLGHSASRCRRLLLNDVMLDVWRPWPVLAVILVFHCAHNLAITLPIYFGNLWRLNISLSHQIIHPVHVYPRHAEVLLTSLTILADHAVQLFTITIIIIIIFVLLLLEVNVVVVAVVVVVVVVVVLYLPMWEIQRTTDTLLYLSLPSQPQTRHATYCWILLNCLYSFLINRLRRILFFIFGKLLCRIICFVLNCNFFCVDNVRRTYMLINLLGLKRLNLSPRHTPPTLIFIKSQWFLSQHSDFCYIYHTFVTCSLFWPG